MKWRIFLSNAARSLPCFLWCFMWKEDLLKGAIPRMLLVRMHHHLSRGKDRDETSGDNVCKILPSVPCSVTITLQRRETRGRVAMGGTQPLMIWQLWGLFSLGMPLVAGCPSMCLCLHDAEMPPSKGESTESICFFPQIPHPLFRLLQYL